MRQNFEKRKGSLDFGAVALSGPLLTEACHYEGYF